MKSRNENPFLFSGRDLDKTRSYNYCFNMSMKTTIRKIGNSYGIILPKEALHALKVKEGDAVYLTDAPKCTLRITPDRDEFSRKAEIAEKLMSRYRNALQELAK